MFSLDNYKEAFACLPEGAREAEVNAETHEITRIGMENGQLTDTEVSASVELFIRVSGEKTGYMYTQDAAEDAAAALRIAYENGAYSDRKEPEAMAQEALAADLSGKPAVSDVGQLAKIAADIEKRVKARLAERLAQAGCEAKPQLSFGLKAETYGQHTVNSHGLDVNAANALYILTVSGALDREGGNFDIVKEDPEAFDAEKLADDLFTRLMKLEREGQDFVSGEQEVILSEDAVSQLMMTAWQEFSAAKYADGACAMAGLLGSKVSSKVLSITDYPQAPEGGFPALADAEGTVGTPVKIIDKGVFTGLMSNRTSAKRLGIAATGNAGRRPLMFGNIATDILVTPKNFCIEPGTSTLQEMEEHMGDGILITEYFDLFHTLDISSGNFSVPCYGVLIRGGKEAGVVRGLTMSGNFRDMLSGIVEVGDTRVIHPMEFLENYGIGSCALRVGKLSVSGE